MRPGHFLLALATVAIWGFNFVVIKWGLQGLPPILFTTLRFVFAALPAIFFVRPPAVPLRLLAAYAFFQFALQFTLLFVGMKLGMPAGLSSLVIQLQAFFTIGLAVLVLGDRPRPLQLLGAAIAFGGMLLVGLHVEGRATVIGFLLVVGGGLSWGLGNLCTKRMGSADALALVAWGSLIAAPLLLAVSLLVEGPGAVLAALTHMSWASFGAVLFQAYPTTVFGFAVWSFLLRRYPIASIAPFTLLVPIFGMLSGTLLLGEPVTWWKIAAAALVLAGLGLNQLAGRIDWRPQARAR